MDIKEDKEITMMKNAVCYSCLHSKDIAKECPNNGICLIRQKLKDMYTNNIKRRCIMSNEIKDMPVVSSVVLKALKAKGLVPVNCLKATIEIDKNQLVVLKTESNPSTEILAEILETLKS